MKSPRLITTCLLIMAMAMSWLAEVDGRCPSAGPQQGCPEGFYYLAGGCAPATLKSNCDGVKCQAGTNCALGLCFQRGVCNFQRRRRKCCRRGFFPLLGGCYTAGGNGPARPDGSCPEGFVDNGSGLCIATILKSNCDRVECQAGTDCALGLCFQRGVGNRRGKCCRRGFFPLLGGCYTAGGNGPAGPGESCPEGFEDNGSGLCIANEMK